MNSQREAFEKYWLKVTCGTDPAVWDSDEEEYEDDDHQLAFQHFRFGMQAAMAQGGEPVGEIAISNDGNSAQLFYSPSKIKALGLEDGSFVNIYTHPPKPAGEIDEPVGTASAYEYAKDHHGNMTISCSLVVDLVEALRSTRKPTGGGVPDNWRQSLQELVDAMVDYEMDVECEPPYRHRAMMNKARALLATQQLPEQE